MGFMRDDPRGFVVSLDLLIAIIPLTIVLGMVAADMSNIMFEIEDSVFRSSNDRIAQDTVNVLLETSGDPPTWELTGTANVVGLAEYDPTTGRPTEGTISPSKLALLSDPAVQNIIGPNYGYALYVNTTDTNTNLKTLGNYNSSAKDIVRVEKVALCSRLDRVTYLVGQIRYSGQTRNYVVPSFNTSYFSNQKYDYWILFINTGQSAGSSATLNINGNTINLNSTTIFSPNQINSNLLMMNASNPTQSLANTVTLNITGSVGSSMDFYIVQAPKNTTSSDITYDNVVPKKCLFVFFLWTK